MPQKKKKREKRLKQKDVCGDLKGNKFCATVEGVGTTDWVELICLPYSLCGKFWKCCISLCAGGNQCLVYWFCIQWIICKLTSFCTPDPLIFPYYFYVFFQVTALTLAVWLIGLYYGDVFVAWFKAAWYAVAGARAQEEERDHTMRQREITDRIEEALRQQKDMDLEQEELREQERFNQTDKNDGKNKDKNDGKNKDKNDGKNKVKNTTRLLASTGLRKYCFKKSDLFEMGELGMSQYDYVAAVPNVAMRYDCSCVAVTALNLIVYDYI